jgi:hypothetical protein
MDMLNLLSTGNVSRAASLARIEGKMGTLGDYHGVPPSRRVTSKESRPYRVATTKVETPEFPQRVFSISGINRRIAKGSCTHGPPKCSTPTSPIAIVRKPSGYGR